MEGRAAELSAPIRFSDHQRRHLSVFDLALRVIGAASAAGIPADHRTCLQR